MRDIKMLGLVAVAVGVLLAVVSAGTASADELCTEPPNAMNMCPAGKLIEKTEMSLIGTATLEDTNKNPLVTCSSGSLKITSTNAANGNQTGSSSITGEVTKEDLTFGMCNFSTTPIKGGTVNAVQAAGGGTTISAIGVEWTVNTVLFGSCTYGVGSGIDLGTVAKGGNTLTINTAVNKIAGLCPSSSIWNATFKITNHTAMYYIVN